MRPIDGDALMKDLVNAIASQKRWMDGAKKSNSGTLFQLAQQAFFTLLECKQHLEQAPTISPAAQPTTDEWCHDCKEYDQERNCCPRFNRVIRTALKDAQPQRMRGRWVTHGIEEGFLVERYSCSICDYYSGNRKTNYCPNCGADMREGQDED